MTALPTATRSWPAPLVAAPLVGLPCWPAVAPAPTRGAAAGMTVTSAPTNGPAIGVVSL